MDSEKDFKSRKGLAWETFNKLQKLWHLIYLFQGIIEHLLLYGSETWTLKQKNQKRLDGTYTNLLRIVQNTHSSEHPTKERIYGDLPPISDTLSRRRLLFAGRCLRAEDEINLSLLLWKINIPIRSRRMTYPQMLSRDTGIGPEDLGNTMLDRDLWKTVHQNIPASGAEG